MQLDRPATRLTEFITYYLLVSIPYVAACWLVTRTERAGSQAAVLRLVWFAALAFRLTVAPLYPSLSEDSVRYRWQGMVQLAGGDPYVSVPADPAWEGLRDDTWPRVAGKDMPSPYGPVTEQVNLWTYWLVRHWDADAWRQVRLFKLPFGLADLAVGIALMALLGAVGRPRSWALVYLWSPLAVTEFWIEGHNDALALVFVVVALTLSARRRPVAALVALSVATMCKFWPIVLLPFVALRTAGGRWRVEWQAVMAGAAAAAALCLPYRGSIAGVLSVLEGFAGQWRNNDSLFAAFLELTGGDMAAAAGLAQSVLLAAIVAARLAPLPALAGELAAVCALLLVSPNCFPWYLTWMLPLLAVRPSAPLLLWTASVALAHHVVAGYETTGYWEYDPYLVGLEYAPVLVWLAILPLRRAPTGRRHVQALRAALRRRRDAR